MIDAHAALRSSRRDLLLPLMVGATGHRDLDPDAVPDLTAKVHEIFLELRRNSPYTPIVVMSGLAEGADRLIARAALAAGIDAELIAVLPMDRETYIHDFETPESIAEFDTLIGRASEIITLDRSLHGGSTNSDPGNDARMLAYQRLGRFLASRCHVMVALWDGERGQPGGTAEVVDRMLTRGSASDSGDGAAKTFNVAGPVFQIVTPRLRHAMRRPVERCDLLPQNDEFEAESPADSCRRHIFAPLERFNREVCALEAAEFAEIEASERDLVPDAVLMDPELAPLRDGLMLIRRRFGIANAIAQQNRDRTRRTLWELMALVFLAALLVDLSMHLFNVIAWPRAEALTMIGYPTLMMAAFLLWWRVKRDQLQDRYQDFRALAEGLRVQFFWRLAGVDDTVSDHYVGRHRWELDWIRDLCRDALVAAGWPLGKLTAGTAEIVRRYWVQAQYDYFTNAIRRQHRVLRRWELANWLLLAAGLSLAAAVGAGALLALHYNDLRWERYLIGEHRAHGIVLVAITMTAVAAALSHFRLDKLALHSHVRMYQRMKLLYAAAREHMTDVAHPRFGPTLQWLGAQALLENGEWVVTHRDRPLEVPHH